MVPGCELLYYALRQAPQINIYETLVCVMLHVHNKFYNNILYYAYALYDISVSTVHAIRLVVVYRDTAAVKSH